MDAAYFAIDFRQSLQLFCGIGLIAALFALCGLTTLVVGLRTYFVIQSRTSLMSSQSMRLHIQLIQQLFLQALCIKACSGCRFYSHAYLGILPGAHSPHAGYSLRAYYRTAVLQPGGTSKPLLHYYNLSVAAGQRSYHTRLRCSLPPIHSAATIKDAPVHQTAR